MIIQQISASAARKIALDAQKLSGPGSFGKGRQAVLRAIRHLGYVQIDTISVIARAHHHVLWSRVPGYRKAHLADLLERQRSIFEYWSHAAAYLPIEDFRYSLPRMHHLRGVDKGWFKKNRRVRERVIARIRSEGPLMARHFQDEEVVFEHGWGDWKAAKLALEQLFHEGYLLVTGRQGFQKIYDLAERVLPADVDCTLPGRPEVAGHLIERALNAHGLTSLEEIAYLRGDIKKEIRAVLAERVEAEELVAVRITEDAASAVYFVKPDTLETASVRRKRRVFILSPFDNSVIQRKRLQRLFGFDYQIECYVPEAKRKFGYFCLPILYGNSFIGRIDCKADRKRGTFIIKHLYIEDAAIDPDKLAALLGKAIQGFARFNQCDKIMLERVIPVAYFDLFKNLIQE